ncbi:tRNA preQ1(34) S-adenosylmethionine ribosyltransferase-isomerase QueA [bacterium]|nr:tRNA preQ1(34) S-adenosylmethionine ribosyltransferase-isomerase QueA [candidate division CSSED10-310 bacterium]
MKCSDFKYDLPRDRIAQFPPARRDSSRLMVLNRRDEIRIHTRFRCLFQYLTRGDLLIFNDVRVIPARFRGFRRSGGTVEILILDGWSGPFTRVLIKPGRRVRENEIIDIPGNWRVRIRRKLQAEFMAEFEGDGTWHDFLDRWGEMPVPPYIKRKPGDNRISMDRDRYQTVYARRPGAVAAPTAGLHFTPPLISRLERGGIETASVTLWIGWGTFRPVEVQDVADHRMEPERYRIPPATAVAVARARSEQRRIVAVGTTTVRALESWAEDFPGWQPVHQAEASIFIVPGHRFKVVDSLITNFHLPGSTLIMLVSALVGRENLLEAYRDAVHTGYRFYSYGDAMLIV